MKKNNTIQLMRGLAIIVVLMHHSISQISMRGTLLDVLDSILICFHMPTFFVISGYLYERSLATGKKSFLAFLSGKTKRLIIPYLFWTVILWGGVQIGNVVNGSFMKEIGFPPMGIGSLIVNILTYEVYYVELLWFLYVLFLLFIFNYLIGRIGRNKLFICFCIVIGISTIYVNYPNIINRFLLWMVFFAVGRVVAVDEGMKQIIENGRKNVVINLIAFIVLVVIRIFLERSNLEINIYVLRGIKQLVKYAIGFLGVWLVYIAALAIEKTRFMSLLKTIGDYSYDIYLMHNPYVVALTAIVCSRFLKLPGVCSMIIATALGVSVPILISKLIIRRSKFFSAVMIGN